MNMSRRHLMSLINEHIDASVEYATTENRDPKYLKELCQWRVSAKNRLHAYLTKHLGSTYRRKKDDKQTKVRSLEKRSTKRLAS